MNWKEVPRDSGVYAIRSEAGVILYVGSSIDLRRRCQEHRFTVPIRFEVLELCSPERRREREQFHMLELKPILNRSRAIQDDTLVRASVVMTPPQFKKVQQVAKSERWSVAATLRVLVTRGLETT